MVKDYTDYLGKLQLMYPDLSVGTLKKAVTKGLFGIQDLACRDHDIRLENTNGKFDKYRILFYRSMDSEESKMKRYFKNLIRITTYREDKKQKYAKKLQSK